MDSDEEKKHHLNLDPNAPKIHALDKKHLRSRREAFSAGLSRAGASTLRYNGLAIGRLTKPTSP